jgi:hypothetical protein
MTTLACERSTENTDASTTPSERVTRANSRRQARGSAKWLSTKDATTASKVLGPNGNATTSPATRRARSGRPSVSMDGSRSTATTAAPRSSSTSPTAPVPAPASSTREPAHGRGLLSTRWRHRPICELGVGRPSCSCTEVGLAERIGAGHGNHVAPCNAASVHHFSSSGSPTAFSQAKPAMIATKQRPSWRSHQEVVSMPCASSRSR